MGDIGERPVLPPRVQEKKLYTFDDVIRERAEDLDQVPLVAYPKAKDGVDDYEFFTGKELNRLVDGAAKALIGLGVAPVVRLFLFSSLSNISPWLRGIRSKLRLMLKPVYRHSSCHLWSLNSFLHHHNLRSRQVRVHNIYSLPSAPRQRLRLPPLKSQHHPLPLRITIPFPRNLNLNLPSNTTEPRSHPRTLTV